MKKRLLICSAAILLSWSMCIPVMAQSGDQDKGIAFVHGLTWSEIKARAKAENKYIFVDAYTTWCAPCKKMDREVFPNDTVGEFMNARFIAIKVQMDSTGRDKPEVRKWYTDARMIENQFKVNGFPTYLFFNPEGTLIYKSLGFHKVPDFLAMVNQALDPENMRFYTLLDDYQKGRKDYASMFELIDFVFNILGDEQLAKLIANDYISNATHADLLKIDRIMLVKNIARNGKLADQLFREYMTNHLNKLDDAAFLSSEGLRFIEGFNYLITPGDKIFQLSYDQPDTVDQALFSGAAKHYVLATIIREELTPRLLKEDKPLETKPDWVQLTTLLKNKYPKADIDDIMLLFQLGYYQKANDCRQWAHYKNLHIRRLQEQGDDKHLYYELDDLGAWEVFMNCSDTAVLKEALNWINMAIKLTEPEPGIAAFNTRANVLYKLGRVREAIKEEERAIATAISLTQKEIVNLQTLLPAIEKYKEVLETMKKREPTYARRAIWDSESIRRIKTGQHSGLGKQAIDTSTFDNWLSVKPTPFKINPVVSNDGKYVFYKVTFTWRKPVQGIVQSTSGDWKQDLEGVDRLNFTANSGHAIYLKPDHTLCMQNVGGGNLKSWPGIAQYKLVQQGNREWLIMHTKTTDKALVIERLDGTVEQRFPHVVEYLTDKQGNNLVVKTISSNQAGPTHQLHWVNVKDGNSRLIWQGDSAYQLMVNKGGEHLAFRTKDGLWMYKKGFEKARQLALQFDVNDKALEIENITELSNNGQQLFVRLKEKKSTGPAASYATKVDVYSYTDPKLQSAQLEEIRWASGYLAVISTNDGKVRRLQSTGESPMIGLNNLPDSLIILTKRSGQHSEWNWNATAVPEFYLVNTSTGSRRMLDKRFIDIYHFVQDRYLVGYDRNWEMLSHDLVTGITRHLTAGIDVPRGGKEFDQPYNRNSRGFSATGKLMKDGSLIMYDNYDVWKISLSGNVPPVNLTNGYGRKNGIQFRLAAFYKEEKLDNDSTLILWAFDKKTKNNGFFSLDLAKSKVPVMLSMGPYYFDLTYDGSTQVKAKDKHIYVVVREQASTSPNFFWTSDFKTFNRLSDVAPEQTYNWVTSQLVNFTTTDGRAEQAAVYKPENFDPKKKYPVIIHYYDRKTQDLNTYHRPGEENGHIDIAWFVSNGYVVVTPDIHFKIGAIGESAVSTVVGLADHLSKLPWVDGRKIGLQGHSLGGYQTNYIVTRTNHFAAAVSSSGMSNIISNYLGFLGGGSTNHDWYENRICRIGATLWEAPYLYIHNSPIFQAHRVSTPILTIANKQDHNVYFEQGIQWFTALRRLGKKAWMLQYDGESHGVGGKAYQDYVLRMGQFFDHYLKGAPAPKWMTRGIPAKMKGIDNGLELDTEIKTPGDGLLAPDQKEKVEVLKNKKPVTIKLD